MPQTKPRFGDHPSLLISFLNAVLPLPLDRPIVELTYLTPEQAPHIPILKRTIADVKCKDSQGRVFIVEMQIDWTEHWICLSHPLEDRHRGDPKSNTHANAPPCRQTESQADRNQSSNQHQFAISAEDLIRPVR